MAIVQPYPNSNNGFDENAKKYMCCCGCMHSRLAVQIFVVLELVVYLGMLGFLVYQIISWGGEIPPVGIISLAVNAIYITCIVLALYGIQAEHPCCLVPYAVLQALALLGSVGYFVVLVIGLINIGVYYCSYDYYSNSRSCFLNTWSMILISMMLIMFVFKVWILVVVARCHTYLRAKQCGYQGQISPVVAYETPQVYNYPANQQYGRPPPFQGPPMQQQPDGSQRNNYFPGDKNDPPFDPPPAYLVNNEPQYASYIG